MPNLYQEYGAKLLTNGYLIIPIKPGSKRPSLSAWQDSTLGVESLRKYPGCGIGIITGRDGTPICAIDIDIKHPELAHKFSAWCLSHLGATAERVGDAPKILLPYRASESDWKKQISATFEDATGYRGKVEFLGKGQQFVAYHIHPDTKAPYEWTDFLGGLTGLAAADLPVITLEQIEEAIEAFEQMALEVGLKRVTAAKEQSKPSAKVVQLEQKPISDDDFFRRVNQAAMENLSSWVPVLFSAAREYDGGYRVHSEDLGRTLQEDLGIHPSGIVDHGVADMGDEKGGKRTPIDLLIEWSQPLLDIEEICSTPFDAAQWLCNKLGVTREQLGYGLRRKREQDAEKVEKKNEIEAIKQEINATMDSNVLLDEIAPRAAIAARGNVGTTTEFIGLIRHQFKTITNTPLPLPEARKYLKTPDSVMTDASVNGFHMTELGNTKRMLKTYGDEMMFVPEMGCWFTWYKNKWIESKKGIGSYAKKTVEALHDDVAAISETAEELRATFKKFCLDSEKNAMMDNMTKIAEKDEDTHVSASELNPTLSYLGVANGVIDLKTCELMPADPAYYITRISPYKYSFEAQCPLFISTLRDALCEDDEIIDFFQMLIGYAMCGELIADKMVIAYGSGGNGKSTIITAILNALGDYGVVAQSSTFLGNVEVSSSANARPDLMDLIGRRLVSITEPDSESVLKTSVVKSMTGREPIPARGLYGRDMIKIKPTWLIIMATNILPIIKDIDDGIWRRIIPIPFDRKIIKDKTIKEDTSRGEALGAKEEAEGILAWCVEGARMWKQHKARHGKMVLPQKIQNKLNEYRSDMDVMANWILNCCELDAQASADGAALWDSWRSYAERNNELHAISSANKLTRRLRRTFEVSRSNNRNIVHGLRLKNDDLDAN